MRWAGNWMNQQRHRTTIMAYNNLVGLAESVTLVMALRTIASALLLDHIHCTIVSSSQILEPSHRFALYSCVCVSISGNCHLSIKSTLTQWETIMRKPIKLDWPLACWSRQWCCRSVFAHSFSDHWCWCFCVIDVENVESGGCKWEKGQGRKFINSI